MRLSDGLPLLSPTASNTAQSRYSVARARLLVVLLRSWAINGRLGSTLSLSTLFGNFCDNLLVLSLIHI